MDTNRTTGETTSILVPQARDGEARTEWTPTIQNAGVDTLEFSFDVEVPLDWPCTLVVCSSFLHFAATVADGLSIPPGLPCARRAA
jgi:hypothetical protein